MALSIRVAGAIDPHIYRWLVTQQGAFAWYVEEVMFSLCVLALFIQPKSIGDFACTVGLDARPSNRGWIATVIAIGVALLVFHYIASANLIQDKLAMKLFRKPHDPKTIYYHLFLLCAPVFEEIVMRGYLYPAFRRGYGIVLSIVIIVLLTGITHSHPMLTSWPGAVLLGGIAIALCLLREWTGSLWNCILPHMAYNATLDFGFAIPLVVVLILFPLCTYEK